MLLLIANGYEEAKVVEHMDVFGKVYALGRILHCAKEDNVDRILDRQAQYQMIREEKEQDIDAKLENKD